MGVCALVLGGCDDGDMRGVVVLGESARALNAGTAQSINGEYSGCRDRSGAWSAEIASGAPLDHEALSVVENDTSCNLTLTSLIADQTYTGLLALTDIYQVNAAAFSAGGAVEFYANAARGSFTSDFTITILSSDDPRTIGGAAVAARRKRFAVFAGDTITNVGLTNITGDLGVSPGLDVTGFPPGVVDDGAIHIANAVALAAQNQAETLHDALGALTFTEDLSGQGLGGQTLTAGIYRFSSTAALTGTLTLDAEGDPDAIFVFQIGSTLTTSNNALVAMVNGGDYCNVYWQVGTSATIGADTSLAGTIIAATDLTLDTAASVAGGAWAVDGNVDMDASAVTAAGCYGGPL